MLTFQGSLRPDPLPLGRFGACPLGGPNDLRGCFRACPLYGPFPMTSEVGTDLRAVRPPGTGPVVLTVESACPGEWRFFVMFAGVALSEKSPYLGGFRVRLSLWQEPGMWPEDLRGRFRACPLCGPFPLEVRGGCGGNDLRGRDRSPSGPSLLRVVTCRAVYGAGQREGRWATWRIFLCVLFFGCSVGGRVGV